MALKIEKLFKVIGFWIGLLKLFQNEIVEGEEMQAFIGSF